MVEGSGGGGRGVGNGRRWTEIVRREKGAGGRDLGGCTGEEAGEGRGDEDSSRGETNPPRHTS